MKVASNRHLLNLPLTKSFCCYHTRRKYKIALLTSSYLHTTKITERKSEIILHYNDIKRTLMVSINCVIFIRQTKQSRSG